MIVYGARPSPFVRKVLVFAAEKAIPVEVRPGGFGQGGDDFARASPFGKIPALVDGDFAISDSSAIITYMDVIQPLPNLIPAAPRARALTIWYDEFGDTIAQPVGVEIFFNRIAGRLMKMPHDPALADAAEIEKLPGIYDYIERVLPDSGWLVEDRFTLADLAVACPLINICYCSDTLADGRWPRVMIWLDAVRARPSVAQAMAAEQAILARVA